MAFPPSLSDWTGTYASSTVRNCMGQHLFIAATVTLESKELLTKMFDYKHFCRN